MINRGDLLMLGLSAGVIGCLMGGTCLGLGLNLIAAGSPAGWLLLLPAAPLGGLPGYILARRLAKQLR